MIGTKWIHIFLGAMCMASVVCRTGSGLAGRLMVCINRMMKCYSVDVQGIANVA